MKNNQDINKLNLLASEIRANIINLVKNNQGHYSSNLGVIEATIALHNVFDFRKDKIIFDIGHQGYTHKYLINKNNFNLIKKENGISGLISKDDNYDDYETGHAGLAIALGYARSLVSNYKTIIFIGDGGFANGINLAGLNELAKSKDTILIINNNKMNISPSEGPIYNILNNPINAKNYFTSYGFDFFYQANGNNISKLINDLVKIKKISKPVVYLIETIKGLGDLNAQNDKLGIFHHTTKFKSSCSYPQLVADTLLLYIKKYLPYVIQSGMSVGFNMLGYKDILKDKYLDLGMNEELSLATAYGLLLNKKQVVIPMYATFLQRGYDQLINDIGRLKLKPLLLINRAGLIDYDGPTHQGIYANNILLASGFTPYYPLNKEEINIYLNNYFTNQDATAIVYSKEELIAFPYQLEKLNSYYFINNGIKKVVLSYGYLLAKYYSEYIKLDLSVINTTGVFIDKEMLDYLAKENYTLYIIEEAPLEGSLYLMISNYFKEHNYPNKVVGRYITKKDLPANSLANLLKLNKLDLDSIKLLVNR